MSQTLFDENGSVSTTAKVYSCMSELETFFIVVYVPRDAN